LERNLTFIFSITIEKSKKRGKKGKGDIYFIRGKRVLVESTKKNKEILG